MTKQRMALIYCIGIFAERLGATTSNATRKPQPAEVSSAS